MRDRSEVIACRPRFDASLGLCAPDILVVPAEVLNQYGLEPEVAELLIGEAGCQTSNYCSNL